MTPPFWCREQEPQPDQAAHFRAHFTLDKASALELHHTGCGGYLVWLDGELLCDGPPRFQTQWPEYQVRAFNAEPGQHRLDILATHFGVETRLLHTMVPFVYARLVRNDGDIALPWKGRRLDMPSTPLDPIAGAGNGPVPPGRIARLRRISPQLGWMENVDTRREADVLGPDESLPAMSDVAAAPFDLSNLRRAHIDDVLLIDHRGSAIASGHAREMFGYENDDPPVRFFLRDLSPRAADAEGVWRRYDLGRVRLARPRFVIEAPAGTVIEFATCESLLHDRVSPFITLSLAPTANMVRYVARGGAQEYMPIVPLGGRFWEVHAMGDPAAIRFLGEGFSERVYFGQPTGSFGCSDPLLDRIWSVGVESLRACSEDAVVDNPTRERGQWTGDVVTIAADIAAVAFGDLSLTRRACVQAAQSARADGMIAGMHPGEEVYLSTYALLWHEGVVRCAEMTNDMALLREVRDAAARNLALFRAHWGEHGLRDIDPMFVDWGYVRNTGPVSVAFNLFYLMALRGWQRSRQLLGEATDADAERHLAEVESVCHALAAQSLASVSAPLGGFRFHDTVLALRLGLVPDEARRGAIEAIKAHILACYPNDPTAPRLASPAVNTTRLITPYFMHYCLPLLIEAGEMDFVLGQYRHCWGWALDAGLTTWPEVFDLRWSHCHAWASCPTWQLSRYVLGLHAVFNPAGPALALRVEPGDLQWARGTLPLGREGKIDVSWQREATTIKWSMRSTMPVRLHLPAALGKGALFEGVALDLDLPIGVRA